MNDALPSRLFFMLLMFNIGWILPPAGVVLALIWGFAIYGGFSWTFIKELRDGRGPSLRGYLRWANFMFVILGPWLLIGAFGGTYF